MLRSYINAFTCKRYVVSTYDSLVNIFHETDTYRKRITQSTDPDWNGTATEQTDIQFFSTRPFLF